MNKNKRLEKECLINIINCKNIIDTKDLWENKYVQYTEKESEKNILFHYDKYNACLYAVNNIGGVQRYYNNEEEYLETIKGIKTIYIY